MIILTEKNSDHTTMEYLHGLSDHALAYRMSQVTGNLTAFK
jgi:hypothetical protein